MTITEAWAIWPDTSRARLQAIAEYGPDWFDLNEKKHNSHDLVRAARILLDVTGIHGTKAYPEAQPQQFF